MHENQANAPGLMKNILSRLGLVITVFLTLNAVTGFYRATAAGWCKGDQERFRGVIERVEYKWAMLREELKAAVSLSARQSKALVANLALWTLYQQATAAIRDELHKPKPSIEAVLDEKLKNIWFRSDSILLWFNPTKHHHDHVDEDLGLAIKETFLPYAICRSLKTKTPSPCRILNWFEPSLTDRCTDFFVDVGIVLSGDCNPELVEKGAALWQVPTEYLAKRCKIFSSSDPSRCADLDFASDIDLATCWAVTSGNSSSCDDSDLDKEERLECHRTSFMAKKIKHRDRKILEFAPGLLERVESMALKTLLDPKESCPDLAIDSFTQSVASRFLLKTYSFGALP